MSFIQPKTSSPKLLLRLAHTRIMWSLLPKGRHRHFSRKSFMPHTVCQVTGPAPTGNISPVPAVPYTVKRDETFYQIAKAHGVTMKQLLELNPDTVTVARARQEPHAKGKLGRVVMLHEGQSLMVPAEVAPLAWRKLLCGRARCAATAAKQHLGTFSVPRGIYTVKTDDTLTHVAEQFGTTPEVLSWMNGQANVNNIAAGQKLRVPAGAVDHVAFSLVSSGTVVASRLQMKHGLAATEPVHGGASQSFGAFIAITQHIVRAPPAQVQSALGTLIPVLVAVAAVAATCGTFTLIKESVGKQRTWLSRQLASLRVLFAKALLAVVQGLAPDLAAAAVSTQPQRRVDADCSNPFRSAISTGPTDTTPHSDAAPSKLSPPVHHLYETLAIRDRHGDSRARPTAIQSAPLFSPSSASAPGPGAGPLENHHFSVLEMARRAKQERAPRQSAEYTEKPVSLSNMVMEAKERERRLKEARRELMMSGLLGTDGETNHAGPTGSAAPTQGDQSQFPVKVTPIIVADARNRQTSDHAPSNNSERRGAAVEADRAWNGTPMSDASDSAHSNVVPMERGSFPDRARHSRRDPSPTFGSQEKPPSSATALLEREASAPASPDTGTGARGVHKQAELNITEPTRDVLQGARVETSPAFGPRRLEWPATPQVDVDQDSLIRRTSESLIKICDGAWSIAKPSGDNRAHERMMILRLEDGSLFLHCPLRYSRHNDQLVRRLGGPVAHIVMPMNDTDALAKIWLWAKAFPKAHVHVLPALQKRLALQLKAAGTKADPHALVDREAPEAWSGQIEQVCVKTSVVDEVVFLHRASKMLLTCKFTSAAAWSEDEESTAASNHANDWISTLISWSFNHVLSAYHTQETGCKDSKMDMKQALAHLSLN